MAEDRMLNDEILLGLIKSNSGGGGGGTDDYNDLENLPQIGGVTLQGNKTASDLGLASEEDLEEKQDVLTAGNYISIANDGTISVTQSIGVYDVYSYVVAGRAGNNYYYVDIQKYENGVLRSNTRYVNDQCYNKKIIDDRFSLQYDVGGDFSWHFVLLTDSNEHKEGESIVWRYNVTKDFTETFNVSQDESTDLATKGDVENAIDTIKDGQNIDSFADVESALALKQDTTDNSLETTAKTIVGAINEHEGDIGSLRSGLTNLTDDVKLNTQDLTTPSRTKNLIPTTLDILKTANTSGTWSGNAYTAGEVTYTVNTDSDWHVTSIGYSNSSTVSENQLLIIPMPKDGNNYLFNGGISSDCFIFIWDKTVNARAKKWDGTTNSDNATSSVFKEVKNVANHDLQMLLRVSSGVTAGSGMFYPMLCKSTETDPTFVPYIPSVDARLDAVESGLTNVESNLDDVVVEYTGPAHSSDGRYYYFYFTSPFQSTCNRIFFDITYGSQHGYPKNAICMYNTDGSTTAWVNTDDTNITNALSDGELVITIDCGASAWVIPVLRIKKKYGDLLTIR